MTINPGAAATGAHKPNCCCSIRFSNWPSSSWRGGSAARWQSASSIGGGGRDHHGYLARAVVVRVVGSERLQLCVSFGAAGTAHHLVQPGIDSADVFDRAGVRFRPPHRAREPCCGDAGIGRVSGVAVCRRLCTRLLLESNRTGGPRASTPHCSWPPRSQSRRCPFLAAS